MKTLIRSFFLMSLSLILLSASDLKGVKIYQEETDQKDSLWTVVSPSEEVREQSRLGIKLIKEEKYKEALNPLKRAAELQNAGSRYNLGVLYEYGLGVEASLEEAARWYSACGLDFPNASEALDRVIRKKQLILEEGRSSFWSRIAW